MSIKIGYCVENFENKMIAFPNKHKESKFEYHLLLCN